MKKERFYVFLDVDGVLWDWEWRIQNIRAGRLRKGGVITEFNKDSIDAVNALLDCLGKRYNCRLVLSSTWRLDKNLAKEILMRNGLTMDYGLDFTPVTATPKFRGREILTYLDKKANPQNILIIDDEQFDFEKYFKKSQMIKTDIFKGGINRQAVDKWLKAHGMEIMTEEDVKVNEI